MNQSTISQRLKDLIEALKISSRAFSATLEVSDANTRNYIDRGSKPNADYLERIIRKFESVNPTWLLTGEGSMFKSEVAEPATTYQKISNQSGINIAHNYGTATQKGPVSKEALEQENAELRAQIMMLQQRVIDLQERLLNPKP